MRDARSVVASFLIALKNFSLYPENHDICQKSLSTVKTNLDRFLAEQKTLRLAVEKDRVCFQGETVHSGPPQEGSLPFVLFRDGVHWLEFHDQIEQREVSGFFRILNSCLFPQEDAEGDMVTALWKADFPHIRYEADDGFPESESLFDFSRLSVNDGGKSLQEKPPAMPGQPEAQDAPKQTDDRPVMAAPAIDSSLYELDPEEAKALQKMVLEEENQTATSNVLEMVDVVLMVILKEQTAQEDSEIILDFLKDEFRNTLEQCDLGCAVKFLENMHGLLLSFEIEKPWAVRLLNRFFDEISSPQVLDALPAAWPLLEGTETDHKKLFLKLLALMPPHALPALAPMLLQTDSPHIQNLLTEGITSLAARDIGPLEEAFNHQDQALVHRLISVLEHVKGNDASRLLMKMVRHSSQLVRKDALRILLNHDPNLLKEFFSFVEDPSEIVRWQMLKHIGLHRDMEVESLMIDYLQKARFKVTGSQHLLSCYWALGRCGSSLCVPFLSDLLFSSPWNLSPARSVLRQCAASALTALGSETANEILEKASRSLFPNLRRVCRRAAEGSK